MRQLATIHSRNEINISKVLFGEEREFRRQYVVFFLSFSDTINDKVAREDDRTDLCEFSGRDPSRVFEKYTAKRFRRCDEMFGRLGTRGKFSDKKCYLGY